MEFVQRDDVRRLLDATEPDAALTLVGGKIVVAAENEAEGLVIVSRQDLEERLAGEDLSDHDLDRLADALDTVARDLGA
ncbi:hypothetical protein N5079_05310 [Planotetraspora sp. A-T 1434]|uniref:hypothetical protein n=1 Tax=Planotetraspora sp. A-T 1434 TaxID=2979219 RepID=UPI0021BEA381|nr:hypothetical protein [Planotetraspora sp. A-T 1434]MCT9929636.1 hypothetical protein [Planotetraspora sp. A-T 1434]